MAPKLGLTESEAICMLAFRGTAKWENWITDFHYVKDSAPKDWHCSNCIVHKGFVAELRIYRYGRCLYRYTGMPIPLYRYTGNPNIWRSVLVCIEADFCNSSLIWNLLSMLKHFSSSTRLARALPTFAQFFVGIFWAVFPGFFLLGILTFAPLQAQHLQFFASFRNISAKLKILNSRWIFIKMIWIVFFR